MKPAKIPQTATIPGTWSDMPWGEYYRDALTTHLKPCLMKLYGTHLVKIGQLSAEIDTKNCPIDHQINLAPEGKNIHLRANPLFLPFVAKSIDACILAHTLAWSHDPHRMLREVDRVLIDDGWLIISGFNPFSVLRVGKLIPGLHHCVPWNGHMYSQGRLTDWLSLLNYEVIQRTCFQVLPWNRQGGVVISTHFPALGCISLLVARKRTLPLTLNLARKMLGKPRFRPAVGTTRHHHTK